MSHSAMRIKISAAAAVSLLLIIALSFSGCASSDTPRQGGKAPQWTTDKDSVYPPDRYLAELGQGDSLNDAKAAAAGAIAQIFRSRITVDNTVRTRYMEISGSGGADLGMLQTTEVDQSIGQSSDETLVNLKYGEAWIDDLGRTYTVAYLDRLETGNLYRQRIIENDSRVSELLDRAHTQDDPLRRFAFLDAALVTAQVNQSLVEQLEIINMPMARSVMHPYDLGELRSSREDQGKALQISVEVFGDPEGRIGAVLADWITRRGFTASNAGDMFLSAMTSLNTVALDNGYDNFAWELNLTLMDVFGYAAVTMPKTGRSTGISESAARERAYADMATVISKDFDRAFSAYLDSFLEK